MGSKLKPIDLTGATVGTTGVIDFNQFAKFNPQTMEKAHIRLLNESGAGLDVRFLNSGNYHFLPAGAWGTFDLEPNDGSLQATVAYVLPSPPVSTLVGIYYAPGEVVPQAFTLGNSPIGIGGTVTTSSVQTLSNEGGAANVLVEDIGDLANAQLYTLYSDGHALWKVDQSGVAHQVLKINTAGNPLQLGQAGDVVEFLGQATHDQLLSLLSNLLMLNATYLQIKDIGGTARGVLAVDAGNITKLRGASTDVNISDVNDLNLMYLTNTPAAAQIVAGQTSGTATLYQYMRGNLKKVVVILNNYKNTGTQAIVLPVAFALRSAFWATEMKGHFDIKLAGVGKNISTVTSLVAGGGGISTNLFGGDYSFGQTEPFDTLDLQLNTAAANGVLIFEGN